MKELVLKVEEVQALVAFAKEIPTKFGQPLLEFINEVGNKRLKEAGLEPVVAEKSGIKAAEVVVEEEVN